MTAISQPTCVACGRGADLVPLLTIEFRGRQARICTEHLPILIHDPGRLAGRLEGAETLNPSEHQD